MANNPGALDPARTTAPNAAYPYGSSKDESSPGAGDGTPYKLQRANDIFGLQQALLRSANITPSGNADTALVSEYLESLIEIASGRAFNYDDSGVANVYVLDPQTNQQGPRSYFDGMRCEFIASNDNTGASTIDVAGLGVKNIAGTQNGGEIKNGDRIELRYRSGSGDFEIINFKLTSGTPIATTSGTAHDFTSIPSWVKKITVMLENVSTNGTSKFALRIGDSGGIENTGYVSTTISINSGNTPAFANTTSQFSVGTIIASDVFNGQYILTLVDSSTNTWSLNGVGAGDFNGWSCSGSKSLSGVLDRIRLTTEGGSDIFDAGKINITYE